MAAIGLAVILQFEKIACVGTGLIKVAKIASKVVNIPIKKQDIKGSIK